MSEYAQGFRDGYGKGYDDGARAVLADVGITQMAMGGMVNTPTLAMLGEAGPEMVIPMTPQRAIKPKRKVSAYHKRLGRAIKALRAKHLLKNGKWRKGWNQKKLMKAAHKAAKKG
jgi:hypothetical protein